MWKLGRIGGGKWERRRGNLDKMVFARWRVVGFKKRKFYVALYLAIAKVV